MYFGERRVGTWRDDQEVLYARLHLPQDQTHAQTSHAYDLLTCLHGRDGMEKIESSIERARSKMQAVDVLAKRYVVFKESKVFAIGPFCLNAVSDSADLRVLVDFHPRPSLLVCKTGRRLF
jgi:hypothetical protein